MYRIKTIKQYAKKAVVAAVLCAVITMPGCTVDSVPESGVPHTIKEFEAALAAANGGTSPDNPVDIAFDGTERAAAIYEVLANIHKYVNLDLSESSVIGFVLSPYPTGSAMIVSIALPDNLGNIGDEAFAGWTQLRNAVISDSVTTIGKRAFFNCISLASITIPHSVTTLSECAFHNCTELTVIAIPESVEYIGRDAFSSCDKLNTVTFIGDGTILADNTVFPCGAQFREATARTEKYGTGSYMALRGVYMRDETKWSRK